MGTRQRNNGSMTSAGPSPANIFNLTEPTGVLDQTDGAKTMGLDIPVSTTQSATAGTSTEAPSVGTRNKPNETGHHGREYEVKFTLWSLMIAMLNLFEGKYIECSITAEDSKGGKFDDTVLHYKLPKGSSKSLYIQAKHKDNAKEKFLLQAKDLLGKMDKQYSLAKYFESFCTLHDEKRTDGAMFALCTNAGVADNMGLMKKVEPTDDILMNFCSVGANIYQLDEIKLLEDANFKKYLTKHKITYTDEQLEEFMKQFFLIVDVEDKKIDENFPKLWKSVAKVSTIPLQMGLIEQTIGLNHLFSEAWKMTLTRKTKTETDIQDFFKAIERNLFYLELKGASTHHRNINSKFMIKDDTLIKSKLYANCKSGGVHEHYTMLDKEKSFNIIHQTAQLLNCGCILTDVETFFDLLEKMLNVYCDLEYSLLLAISCKKDDIRRISQICTKRIRGKAAGFLKSIILVVTSEDEKNDDSYLVSDLTDQSKKAIFEKYPKINLFYTDIPLRNLFVDSDSLVLLEGLMKATEIESKKIHPSVESFEKIQTFYINRRMTENSYDAFHVHSSFMVVKDRNFFISNNELLQRDFSLSFLGLGPFIEHDEPMFFDKLAEMMGLSLPFYDGNQILPTHDHIMNPGFHRIKRIDSDPWYNMFYKVNILLDAAGSGKTTYTNWLTWYLLAHRPSYWIIRINAGEYSYYFEQMLANPCPSISGNNYSETAKQETLKILFHLIYLQFSTTDRNGRSIVESNSERIKRLKEWAECLTLSEDSVVVTVPSDASIDQQIALRVFREKYNEIQIVLLLDGFDEITPHYKDVVLILFSHFAKFKGIYKLFFTSRPYNFAKELKATFDVKVMYRMLPLTSEDQYQFLHNYLGSNITEYCSCIGIQRMYLLEILSEILKKFLKELHPSPLFFRMALDIIISQMKNHVDLKNCTISPRLFGELQSIFGKSRLIEAFLNQKLTIANVEKPGFPENCISMVQIKTMIKNQEKLNKDRLSLLGIYAIVPSDYQLLDNSDRTLCEEYMLDVVEGKEKSGIVEGVQGKVPLFIHRIFAEYFAAHWLFVKRNLHKVKLFLKSEFFWNTENSVVRKLFDEIAIRDKNGRDRPAHLAVMQQDSIVLEHEIGSDSKVHEMKDEVGRTPLHLAVLQNCSTDMVDVLLNKMGGGRKHLLIEKRDTLDMSALDYSVRINSSRLVRHLLYEGAHIDSEKLSAQLLELDVYYSDVDCTYSSGFSSRVLEYVLHEAHIRYTGGLRDLITDRNIYSTTFKLLARYDKNVMDATHDIDRYKPLSDDFAAEIQSMRQVCDIVLTHTKKDRITGLEIDINNLLVQCAKSDSVLLLQRLLLEIENDLLAFPHSSQHSAILGRIIAEAFKGFSFHVIGALIHELKWLTSEHNSNLIPRECENDFLNFCIDRKYEELFIFFAKSFIRPVETMGMEMCPYNQIFLLLSHVLSCGSVRMAQYLLQSRMLPAIDDNGELLVMKCLRLFKLDPKVKCTKEGEAVNNLEALKYVLNRTENIHDTDKNGCNLLHRGVESAQFAIVTSLIEEKHFDVTTVNVRNGWNAFHYCVSEPVESLLFRKCVEEIHRIFHYMMEVSGLEGIHAVDTEGRNVLHLAIINKHFRIAMLILDRIQENHPSEQQSKILQDYIEQSNVNGKKEWGNFICFAPNYKCHIATRALSFPVTKNYDSDDDIFLVDEFDYELEYDYLDFVHDSDADD